MLKNSISLLFVKRGSAPLLLWHPDRASKALMPSVAINCLFIPHQRQNYASKEEMLNSMIADIQKENQHLQSASNTAKAVIADDKKAIAKIQQEALMPSVAINCLFIPHLLSQVSVIVFCTLQAIHSVKLYR